MKYSHIVFDVDGTLIDTFYSNLQSLQDTLKELTGQVHSLEDLTRFFGIPGSDTMAQLDLPDPAGALALWEHRLQDYRHTDKVFEGIPELLAALTAAGCRLGVATSRTRAEFDADFHSLEIARYFPIAICADDTVLHKPHGDPLLKYMERAGCTPGDVLYIGDSLYDMRCAAAAGVDSGLAAWGATKEQPCTYRFSAPAEIAALVLRQTAQ